MTIFDFLKKPLYIEGSGPTQVQIVSFYYSFKGGKANQPL